MSKKKQSFVQGALILMLANIIVKVGGAFFKIPLANAIGDNAMGYFSFSYSIYSMCFLIATAGLPVAISRMIASSLSQKKTREADKIYRVSLLLFVLIGLFATALLFTIAPVIAKGANSPQLALCIRTISPIMFFVCVVSTFRGYFQGHQNMIPTATSQVIEVTGNLLIGLSAGIYANKNGYSAPVVASFALGGITLGAVLSAIYMVFAKTVAKKDSLIGLDMTARSGRDIAKELITIAIPITVSSCILSLTSIIDSMLAVGKLNSSFFGSAFFPVGDETNVAMSLYGAYQAKAVTFFNLPTTIITPFAVSIIPAISGALDRKEHLKKTLDFTFRIVSVICLPCAFGLGVMAKPIISMFFENTEIFRDASGIAYFSADVAAPMLTILAPAVAFSGLITVSAAVLQATGHERKSILSTLCGVSLKAVLVLLFVGTKSIGYYGIPLSTLISYLVMFCFNMFFLYQTQNYRISFRKILLKPLFCALLCGICAGVTYPLFIKFLPSFFAPVCSIFLAGIVYFFTLFRWGGIGKEDVLLLPKGEKLLIILQKLHLVK